MVFKYVIFYGMHYVGKYVLACSMTHATWAYAAVSQLESSIVNYALLAMFFLVKKSTRSLREDTEVDDEC